MKHHDPAAIRRAKIIRTIVMVFLCILSLLPFYLMFVNGTRTSNEVKSGISFWFGSNLPVSYTHLTLPTNSRV